MTLQALLTKLARKELCYMVDSFRYNEWLEKAERDLNLLKYSKIMPVEMMLLHSIVNRQLKSL